MKITARMTVSALALLGAALPGMAHAEAAAADAGVAQLDEIIVTASRRAGSSQRTPQAVSVLDGATLADRGQDQLADIQLTAPSVTFNATSNVGQFYIRGIGNSFINAGGDPGVAFYNDDAYITDQRSTNTGLFDIDRVEVLQGPQGALYGRNAVGGAVNVISARPTGTLEAAADALVGDRGRRESQGHVSGPLGFANTDARFSYQIKDYDGYTKNRLDGQPGAPDRLDGQNSHAFRVQTLTHLPDEGSLRLLFSQYDQDDNGAAMQVVPQPGVIYPIQTINGSVPSSDPRSIFANVGETALDVTNLNAGLEQPIGDNRLSLLANYRSSKQRFINDCDGTAFAGCQYFTTTDSDDFFADAHVASPDEAVLRWLVGATYQDNRVDQVVDVQTPSLLSYLDPTAPAAAFWPFHYNGGGRVKTQAYAIYADARLRLTDIWAVSAQVRYSETTKKAVEFQHFPFFGVNIDGFHNRLKNDFLPFKLGLEGQLNADVLVYASYATADKDGAINLGALQTAPVRPEGVATVELGAKTSFLDRRFRLNGALFSSDYDDLQISQVVGTQVALSNAPRSRIRGAEIEATFLPTRGLTLDVNASLLDPTFKRFANGRVLPGLVGGPVLDLSGKQLPNVARRTLNLNASYDFPVSADFDASVGAQYSWRSRVYFNEFNDRSNSQAAVGLLNLNASLSPTDGPWRLYGYVRNVTDKTVVSGTTIYSGLLGAGKAVSYAAPRTFGIGAGVRF